MNLRNQNLIEFFNLAELATEALLYCLQNNCKKEDDLLYLATNKLLDQKVAVGFLVENEKSEEVSDIFKSGISFEHVNFPNKKIIIFDRFTVNSENLNRIDIFQKEARKHFLKSVVLVKNDSLWEVAIEIDLSEITEKNFFGDLDWDTIFIKFSSPSRYHKFCQKVFETYKINLTSEVSIINCLESCLEFIYESKQELLNLITLTKKIDINNSIKITSKIRNLPVITQNYLFAIRAEITGHLELLENIDGPCELNTESKVAIKNLFTQPIIFKSDSENSNKHIVYVNSDFTLDDTLSEYLKIEPSLQKFYSINNLLKYKNYSIEEYLEYKIDDFFTVFKNHPKFRMISKIWQLMSLPNLNLKQPLYELPFTDKLLIYIASCFSKLREDSVMVLPVQLEGISLEKVRIHILPLFKWCEELKLNVQFMK